MSLLPNALFSVEALLQPIAPDAPAGRWLRHGSEYREIQRARSSDEGLPAGAWTRDEKRSDWRAVEQMCTAVLTNQSKDLQVAGWLTEAWLNTRQVPGLIASLQLLHGLHERFLTTMFPLDVDHPLTAEGGLSADSIEYRANVLQRWFAVAALAIRFVPVSAPVGHSELVPHTFADIEKARYDEMVRRRGNLEAPEVDPAESLQKAMEATPPEWLLKLDQSLAEAEVLLAALDAKLEEAYGAEYGGAGDLRRSLEGIRTFLHPLLPAVVIPLPNLPETILVPFTAESPAPTLLGRVRQLFTGGAEPEAASSGYDTGAPGLPNIDAAQSMTSSDNLQVGPFPQVRGREQAYALLQEIADYLAQTEPHSPVPLLLRRAIRWGSMNFHDLLPELMQHPESIDPLR